MNGQEIDLLLAPYRALDLSDEKGWLCGKLLGDLGADVIILERPGGDPSRNIGPFYHDIPDPEKSLYWFAFNNNKRGITLDIETKDGQEIFKRLVEGADFVIESFSPGYMDNLGIGYQVLSEINPGIIMTSITPFGQTGPYKDYLASDLVVMAMSGVQYLYGDPDRPPVRISFPQAYLHAGADAFVGTLIALYHRELTGEGQYVDTSAQESTMVATFNAIAYWDLNRDILKRTGVLEATMSAPGVSWHMVWPCKDGYVTYAVMGGSSGAKSNKGITEWMNSEGMHDEYLNNMDWDNYNAVKITQEIQDRINQPLFEFFRRHTRQELFDGAVERGIMLYPVNTIEDIMNDPQLKARDFWQKVNHPELSTTITYPGAWMKSSNASVGVRRRAPLIGEHNRDVYQGELGLSRQELCVLKQASII
jgi:crotonobetainyl-CoA:carnitine CoA-transferase CaiB-like acyl-CoA transferase